MLTALDASLIATAAVAGLLATPHCAAMCGTPCAAVCASTARPGAAWWQFAAARTASYAVAGAAAAAVVSALAQGSALSRMLLPVWTAMQWALVALALWWLATGRQPSALMQLGHAKPATQTVAVTFFKPRSGRWRPAFAASLWALWPCGVLQSALVLAALASSVAGGAVVMMVFALASAPGLWWMQRLLRSPRKDSRAQAWALRLSALVVLGLTLASLSGKTAPRSFCWI